MSAFADLMPMLRGALLLEDETFETMRDAPDGMARGLRFLVTIALAVGLVLALVGFLQAQDGLVKIRENKLVVRRDWREDKDRIRGAFAIARDLARIVKDAKKAA